MDNPATRCAARIVLMTRSRVPGLPSGKHNTRSDRRCREAFSAFVSRWVIGRRRDRPPFGHRHVTAPVGSLDSEPPCAQIDVAPFERHDFAEPETRITAQQHHQIRVPAFMDRYSHERPRRTVSRSESAIVIFKDDSARRLE